MAWLDTLLLKSPNPQMRCRAVANLARSTHPSDTERIFASLRDESPQVRCSAVRALGNARSPGARSSLLNALRDPSFQVREAAARALARLGDVKSAEALATCLRDPDAAVRIAVAGGLRSMGWKPSTREEAAWFEISLGNTPAAVSSESIPGVLSAGGAKQDTSFHRRLAVEVLKAGDDPLRIKSLVADLRSNYLLFRIAAVHDPDKISEPQITEALLQLFRHADPEVRLVAAQAVAARDDAPPAHFLSLLLDASPQVRLAAVQFLGRIRSQHIAEVLVPLLADASLQVRQATATALGFIGNASAIEALVVSLADDDDQMRLTVEQALEQIDHAWMLSEAAQKARWQLEALLTTRTPTDALVVEWVISRLPAPTAARG